MIDLHFVGTPNGQKVSILLKELQLPHRVVTHDMLKGQHLTPAQWSNLFGANMLGAVKEAPPAA